MLDTSGPRWATFKQIAKAPERAFAVLLLGHVAVYGLERSLIEGAEMTEIVGTVGAAVWSFADNPIVRLLMIPLAIWLFARGVQRIEKTNERIALQESDARKRAVRIPVMMAEAWGLRRDYQRFLDALTRSKRIVDDFEKALTSIQGREEWLVRSGEVFQTSERVRQSIDQAFGNFLGVAKLQPDAWVPVWQNTQPINPQPARHATIYNVAENGPFFAAEAANLEQIRQRIAALEGMSRQALTDIEALESRITDEGNFR